MNTVDGPRAFGRNGMNYQSCLMEGARLFMSPSGGAQVALNQPGATECPLTPTKRSSVTAHGPRESGLSASTCLIRGLERLECWGKRTSFGSKHLPIRVRLYADQPGHEFHEGHQLLWLVAADVHGCKAVGASCGPLHVQRLTMHEDFVSVPRADSVLPCTGRRSKLIDGLQISGRKRMASLLRQRPVPVALSTKRAQTNGGLSIRTFSDVYDLGIGEMPLGKCEANYLNNVAGEAASP